METQTGHLPCPIRGSFSHRDRRRAQHGALHLKSRGMSTEPGPPFRSRQGARHLQVYVGPEGVLTGSARIIQEAREKSAKRFRQEISRLEKNLERRGSWSRASARSDRVQYEKNELANRMTKEYLAQIHCPDEKGDERKQRGGSSGDGGRPKRQEGQKAFVKGYIYIGRWNEYRDKKREK